MRSARMTTSSSSPAFNPRARRASRGITIWFFDEGVTSVIGSTFSRNAALPRRAQAFNQVQRRAALLLHLRHPALIRALVRPPAQVLGAVAETAAGEVVILHFHHQLRRQRLKFAGALGAPAAGASWRAAGEARRLAQRFQFPRQR